MTQYTEQWTALDQIAERIRALGHILEQMPFLADFAGYDATAIKVALTAALTDVATVFLAPGAYTLEDDYTIASGKTVVLLPGAVLTVASGKTLTCTGTLLRFVTGQIAGAGTVSGSGKLLITTTNA